MKTKKTTRADKCLISFVNQRIVLDSDDAYSVLYHGTAYNGKTTHLFESETFLKPAVSDSANREVNCVKRNKIEGGGIVNNNNGRFLASLTIKISLKIPMGSRKIRRFKPNVFPTLMSASHSKGAFGLRF